ncbi:MAG: hypothetical protein ABIO70_26970 [Pseudomonadota bacterium]
MRIVPLSLLLLTLTACPPKTEDSADTGESPGDSGDTGDTDTHSGESSWTSSAHPDCGPLASVIWLADPTGESESLLMFASTVPDFCATWLASEALIASDYQALYAAYSQAMDDGDYPAACQARLAWEQAYQPYNDAMMPAGSCTLELLTASAEPGSYETADFDAMAALWHAQADLGAAIVAAFDGCEGVTDEASLDARLDAVLAAQMQAMPYWNTSAGAVVLEAAADDVLRATGSDLTIDDWQGVETGTLSFDLYAELCGE